MEPLVLRECTMVCLFQEAVRDVNLGDYPTFTSSKEEEPKQNGPFRYPGHLEVQDKQAIKKYLVQERKIDSRLVNWLIGQDLIAQDKKKNVVFKWREQGGTGDIVGAERQGTVKMENKRGSFKQILPNGKPHTGFTVDVGKPTSIYYFESPIDLLPIDVTTKSASKCKASQYEWSEDEDGSTYI